LPLATLDRYGHLMPGQAKDVARRLDEMARQIRPQPVARRGASRVLRGIGDRSPAEISSMLPLRWTSLVVGTGVDPVTFRFSGGRSAD
jgi:hypothetical protein